MARKGAKMSDSFEMLVDVEVSVKEAKTLSKTVIAELRERGLITGKPNAKCVLGDKGYPVGPKVSEIYQPTKGEGKFWELTTSGVEVAVGRDMNEWALGPSCEGFKCPSCDTFQPPFDDDFDDAVAVALGEWMNETGAALLACPDCQESQSITEWHCKPPFGFGNLSFRFWNWPPFDYPGWKLDIRALVEEITGHEIVHTYGHI